MTLANHKYWIDTWCVPEVCGGIPGRSTDDLLHQFAQTIEDAEKPILSLFGLIVKHCVVFRKPLAIMVFPDGSYMPNNLKTLRELNEHYENVDDILNTPHSVVSISRAYQDLVVGWKDRSFFEELGIMDRHRKVQDALNPAMQDGRIHAAEIKTATP